MASAVGPSQKNPTELLSLSNPLTGDKLDLRISGGVNGIQEIPQTPSTMFKAGGGKKYGDYDPTFAHLEQRTWEGGRAQEDWVDDETRFYDSMNAWTMTPGRAFPAPRWVFGEGYDYADVLLPGAKRFSIGDDVKWVRVNSGAYYARSFTAQASYTPTTIQVLIRRIGDPSGTLTVRLHSDDSTAPGTVLKTATVTTDTITDTPSVLHHFTFTGEALTASTLYWVTVYSDAADSAANHWEVGYSGGGTDQCKTSVNGTDWSNSSIQILFRVVPDSDSRRWLFFMLQGRLYAVSQDDAGGAPSMYMNGLWGVATSGSTTVLTDADGSATTMVADKYIGAWVKIVSGTGAGQYRQITDNDTTSITVGVAFDIAPAAGSVYIIYATNEWNEVAGHGITAKVTDVAVANNIVWFAMGASAQKIRSMRWDTAIADPAHDFYADTANYADFLHVFYDPASATGPQMWRVIGGTTMAASKSAIPAWDADLAFGTGIVLGDQNGTPTGIYDYNDQLYIFKTDSMWVLKNDKASKQNLGLDAISGKENGYAACGQNLFLYFSWAHSMERLYSGTLDDLGMWRHAGMPSGRQGSISALEPWIAWVITALDAETGTSSVMLWDGRGWHELFRAWKAGLRCRNLKFQPCDGTNPRLWISVGGDIVSLLMPFNSLNPTKDTSILFQHEAQIVTSIFDMGAASLFKFWKELAIQAEHLSSTNGNEIVVEYQTDSDIGTSTWFHLGRALISPESVLPINLGSVKKIRFRLRLMTGDASNPPVLIASTLKGFGRTPYKRQWNIKVDVSSAQRNRRGQKSPKPDDVYTFLRDACQSAGALLMRCSVKQMDEVWVIAEPPGWVRKTLNTIQQWWSGTATITLLEG
jgi:hypothetical protein